MQTVLSSVLLDVPRAAVIWLALLGVIVAAVATLIVRPDLFRVGRRIRQAALPAESEVTPERQELHRYAEEVAVAAERAGVTAERRRAEWLTAQEAVEAAWQACQDIEVDLRRLAAATALPLPRTPQTPAEYADRERYLHRAARAAYERQELSEQQLGDALAHRNGWDPRRHPVEQELVLRRAVRDHLLAQHRAAAERERSAWHDAELAAASARSLRDEAFAAAGREPETPNLLPLPGTDHPTPAANRPPRTDFAQSRTAVA
ncbi:hypothetical protein GA0074692_4602 [Micromonospora pallida]|uniref:AP2/ERF domain-containing protein n=1 Tax=Micromonospora pallida TaxID=145854 RepID=A0A1C6T619_9ACTN|nr:hypothetical protein [Micromonospora pallida]SCL37244.1 hypothetical protein GA0074692_4602 [Micromonospora pallida]